LTSRSSTHFLHFSSSSTSALLPGAAPLPFSLHPGRSAGGVGGAGAQQRGGVAQAGRVESTGLAQPHSNKRQGANCVQGAGDCVGGGRDRGQRTEGRVGTHQEEDVGLPAFWVASTSAASRDMMTVLSQTMSPSSIFITGT